MKKLVFLTTFLLIWTCQIFSEEIVGFMGIPFETSRTQLVEQIKKQGFDVYDDFPEKQVDCEKFSFDFLGIKCWHFVAYFEDEKFNHFYLESESVESSDKTLEELVRKISSQYTMEFKEFSTKSKLSKEDLKSYLSYDGKGHYIEITTLTKNSNIFIYVGSEKDFSLSPDMKLIGEIKPNTGTQTEKLPDFSYGNIPYGETYENVLKSFEGKNVKIYKREWNDSNYYLDFISEYNLSLLGTGVSKYKDLSGNNACCFKYPVVKHICIESNEWKNFSSIYLTFVCSYGKNDYTLMMVNKNNKVPDGLATEKLEQYYSEICKSIGGQLTSAPIQFKEDWKRKDNGLYDYLYFKGLGAKWKTNRETIYFLTSALTNTWDKGIKTSELVFLNNEQEQKFLKACEDCKKARELEKNNKVNSATKDFKF